MQANSVKRKRSLLDYFSSTTQSPIKLARIEKGQHSSSSKGPHDTTKPLPAPLKSISEQQQTSRPESNRSTATIPGLRVIEGYITEQEEIDLIRFLDSQKWRTDLSRRVIHYGGTYCLMAPRNATPSERKKIESTIYTADPIPEQLKFVIDRMVHQDDLYAAADAILKDQMVSKEKCGKPELCIVNSYTAKDGISAHVENFRFGSPVSGLTLLNGDYMRFHELTVPNDGSVRSGKAASAERTGRKVDVWLPRRSLLIMSGEAREKWQHEIARGKKKRDERGVVIKNEKEWRRVSLTFRAEKR